jgi:hypothetical protein
MLAMMARNRSSRTGLWLATKRNAISRLGAAGDTDQPHYPEYPTPNGIGVLIKALIAPQSVIEIGSSTGFSASQHGCLSLASVSSLVVILTYA